MADGYSGFDLATLSVTADFVVAGRAPGSELADLAVAIAHGIYEIAVQPPLASPKRHELSLSVADRQGNVTRVRRAFTLAPGIRPTASPSMMPAR